MLESASYMRARFLRRSTIASASSSKGGRAIDGPGRRDELAMGLSSTKRRYTKMN